jgi:hypothetical protein
MTLLTTEIRDPDKALIVYAADRRLSRSDGSVGDHRRKVMPLPGLNGGTAWLRCLPVTDFGSWTTGSPSSSIPKRRGNR